MSASEYLQQRTEVRTPWECWPWKLSVGSHGYGQAFDGQTVVLAHRFAYETWRGPIPEALTVDHLCRNRRCVNPFHLRLLTNVENATDNGFNRRTYCPRGHPYDDENTYNGPGGGRRCRECARITKRLWVQKRRGG